MEKCCSKTSAMFLWINAIAGFNAVQIGNNPETVMI